MVDTAASQPRTVAVIPAYNEGRRASEVARAARPQVDAVVAVDDGSNDDTAAGLEQAGIVLLRNQRNRGKAASLWRGMRHALELGAQRVVTLDADGQHDPADIPRLLAAADRHPGCIVIGSRLRRTRGAPKLRRFANKFANFWISWAAGHRISDSQSGFRVYPARVLREVRLSHDEGHGFVFESEILIDAAWRGHGTFAVPIDAVYFHGGRSSHYKPARDTLRIMAMIALRLLRSGANLPGLWRALLNRPPSG